MPKLTQTPAVWFPECRYCQSPPNNHEQELLDKAPKFCKKSSLHHFREYLIAEFDTLDHAKLTPTGQIEVLNAIHDKTGCDCLLPSIHDIELTMHSPHNLLNSDNPDKSPNLVTIPQAYSPSPLRTHRHSPPRPSTMLDRLKIGPAQK